MRRFHRLALINIVLWTLLPLLPLPIWAFSAGWRWPDLLPEHWSIRAWSYLLSPATRTLPALITSVGLATVVTILALVVGIPAALALSRYHFQGRILAEALVLAPILVPPLTVAMGLQVLFIHLGLADTFLGVILAHLVFALPYVVLILASASAALNPMWERQARSLGASPWHAFWHVTLPLLRPSLAVAALLAFLVSWSQYALTLLIGGGRVFTLPLLIFSTARSSDPTLMAATALLFIAPTVLFLLAATRNLDRRTGGVNLL